MHLKYVTYHNHLFLSGQSLRQLLLDERMEQPHDGANVGFFSAVAYTVSFYRCLLYFLGGGGYKQCTYFADRLQVKL